MDVDVEGLNIQLLCDRSVPIDTLWLEKIRIIEAIQETLRLREAFGLFSSLLRTMLRKARICVKDVMVNISIGDIDMVTIRCGSFTMDADSTIQDISSEALNKVASVRDMSVSLNGNPVIEVDGLPRNGVCFSCNARIFQGSLSLSLDFPENLRLTIRETNFFDIVALLFEHQKTLSTFKPPNSDHALESLRIEYMYMLENPSPNWTERKRFIEMSVSALLVATWRRQVTRNVGINVRDLFSSISNIGSPDRTPPVSVDNSQVLSGPLKIDVRLVNCVVALELPNTHPFSIDVSKSIISLVFPVGNNSEEFTGRFIFSNACASVSGSHKLISFDMNATVLRSLANGTEFDFSIKHSPDGLVLTPSTIKSISAIFAALPAGSTKTASGESIMENVEFLTRDVNQSKVQLNADQLIVNVTTCEGEEPIIFQVGRWTCLYSFTGGLQAKSEPVIVSQANESLASLPGVQIVTDDDGVTSLFVAGPIEVHKFPKSLLPHDVEIPSDILDSEKLRLSHHLFYRIMQRFNLNKFVFSAPLVRIEGFSLERVQVDLVLSDEGFDVSGSSSTFELANDMVTNFQLDPILSKPNKVVIIRASHMGTENQTPIYIETGALGLTIQLPSDHKPALGVNSIKNLIEALKPMVDLDVPKAKLNIANGSEICNLRVDGFRFTDASFKITKLDCELADMECVIMSANDSSKNGAFDPSDVLPNIHINEVYVMGRFERLNEDVIVGCTNFVHSGQTNYSASHIFASTEAGCILEMRNIKANRHRAETLDGIVINLSRQLVKLLEGIVENVPKPKWTSVPSIIPYNFNLATVHFNFRDEHVISHVDLGLYMMINFELDSAKQVIGISDSSRIEVRKIELTELNTKTLVLRNDSRNSQPLRIDCAGKVVIPLDENESVQVNMNRIDLVHGFRFVVEDINEIKRLFELLSVVEIESQPKRSVDLNCAIGVIDPLHVTAYSSGRPIITTGIQAGLVSVYHSVVPNIRSTTKILIPETKIESSIRNLKRGCWDSLLGDCGFSLEVSEFREFGNQEGGSLKVNLSGLGDTRVGITPHTIACIRALTEHSRDTELEATGSDTYHIVNLLNQVIEFRKNSVVLVVPPRNSASVADSIMMQDDDGVEVVSFRILETRSRPAMSSSLSGHESPHGGSEWNLVDVTGSSDIVLEDFDTRIQIVYNIELNKKLIVFSFIKIVKNDSEMPLVLQVQGGSFGMGFHVDALSDGYAWFRTSRRGSVDDVKTPGEDDTEIVLMHREAVSVSRFARFAIKPYGSADFGYSSPLPVSLPPRGKFGLCCQPINETQAFPLYVRIDQQDTESSGSVHLKPCGVLVNNLPCAIEVEVVSIEGILYIELEQILRNSRRVLYNIDLSYCRVRIVTAPDRTKSDWSENIYFDNGSDGTDIRLAVRNGLSGFVTDVKMIYFSDATSKAITFFHPFWLSNCTDVNVIPLIRSNDKLIESVQLGQEGLWYIEPEFDRKLNTMAVTLSRPHTAGTIVSQEASPLDGSYAMLTDGFCLLDPMVVHADTIRHYDDVPGVVPKLMDYTLISVLPRFVVENATFQKVLAVRQFGGGNEFTLGPRDKVSFGFSSLERSKDIQIKVAGVSRWSRFAIPLGVDASHSLFVISDGETEDTGPAYPVPLSVRIETVRGITYIRINDSDSPAYIVENRCPYIHSVIALAPHLRVGSSDEAALQEIVFSPSMENEKMIPVFFENPDRKVVKLIICFDESSKFKEIELDASQFTNTFSEAVKIKENMMNARQAILVPCQGFPVVLVRVIRSLVDPSQIIIAVTPKDTGMSNWLAGGVGESMSPRSAHTSPKHIQPKTSVALNLSRLQLDVCDSFKMFFDEVVLKISKKRHDEISINELFSKSIIIEQTRSEEQVVFATVDNLKGVVLTADRIFHPSGRKESPLSLSDLRLSVSPMELTINNSVLEDIEHVIASFKDAWADQKMIAANSSSIIARSGTPYCLTVDVESVFEMNKLVRTVECHDLRISEVMIHAWSELIYNRSRFISPEIRLILSILSLSDTLRLDGAEINLPSEHIFRKAWRGPSSQLLSTIGDVYKKSLAENAASFSVVASSNMLNVVGGRFFRSSKSKQVIRRLD